MKGNSQTLRAIFLPPISTLPAGKVEIGGKNIALKVCELPFI